MEETWTFENSKSKCCWHSLIFGISWMDPKKLHFPMQIPMCWRSNKNTSKWPCPLLASIWRTTDLRTLKVATDPRRCEIPSATFTRCKERCKFVTYKVQESADLFHHVNKVKALKDELAYLDVLVTTLWLCSKACRQSMNTLSPPWRQYRPRNLQWIEWHHI